MSRWVPYAFVRFLLCFAAGITTALAWPDAIPVRGGVAAIIVLLICFVVSAYAVRHAGRKWTSGACALGWLFLAGYVHVLFRQHTHDRRHLVHHEGIITAYRASILAGTEERPRTWKQLVSLSAVHTNSAWHPVSGQVLLYLDRRDFPEPFTYGATILVRGQPGPVDAPRNPHQFDFRKYLAGRQVYHQHFVRAGEAIIVGTERKMSAVAALLYLRAQALQVFTEHVGDPEARAVASALVLGQRDDLSGELTASFAAAGAMHILAVSGLHVGVVYALLLFLLRPLTKMRFGPWIVAAASLLLLWTYALVTGSSPSAIRAAVMFSFFAVAVPWKQRTQPFNTLAASAFFMLLYDPFLLVSVGFQLSYLAVFGILYFYQRMVWWWDPPGWLMGKVWQMCCVSAAAQLATFPLGLLYFHQFPVYALLSNLVVIPLGFLILTGGLFLLALSWLPAPAAVVGCCVSLLAEGLIDAVKFIEVLPGSAVTGVYISPWQGVLLLLLTVTLPLPFQLRSIRWMYLVLVIGVTYATLGWEQERVWQSIQRLTVYDVRGHFAIDLLSERRLFAFDDSTLSAGQRTFYTGENRMASGVLWQGRGDDQPFVRTFDAGRIIRFKGNSIVHLYGRSGSRPPVHAADLLVVSRNALFALGDLGDAMKCRQLILDSSNSPRVVARLRAEAKRKNINLHYTGEDGAYEFNF